MDTKIEKQLVVLQTIILFQETHGYPPTIRELCSMTGTSSPSTIANRLNQLKEDGYITWKRAMPRTIRVLKGTNK